MFTQSVCRLVTLTVADLAGSSVFTQPFKLAVARLALAFFLVFSLVACNGGGSSAPTAPTPVAPAAPTVTSISISGNEHLRAGFYTPFTATANLSNGTQQAVTSGTWSSDNAAVASVRSNGDVEGNSYGTATITVTANGVRATKGIRVVQNFGGEWRGTYRMMRCDSAGQFTGWCAGLGGVGTILPVSLNLTQGGNTRDVISGQIGIGSFVGNVTGNVTGDGRLNIGANYTVTVSPGLVAVIEVGGWNTRISSTTGMTGGWAHTLRATSLSGNAYQENQIVSMTFNPATSGAPAAPARQHDDGRGTLHSMKPPTLVFPSLEAFAQSMRH